MRPLVSQWPAVWKVTWLITLSRVDLPEPLTPIRATVWPGPMCRLTSRSTQRQVFFSPVTADPADHLLVEGGVGAVGPEALPHMVDPDGALRRCRQGRAPDA